MPNANRDKGLRAERDVAAYLRAAGITTAERSVSTGWHNGTRSLADCGDLKGTPGLCFQIKNLAKPLTDQALAGALQETAEQLKASRQVIGLLIEKRHQCADVGKWHVWLRAEDYVGLVASLSPKTAQLMIGPTYPIRVEMRHIIEELVLFSELAAEANY